MTTKAKNRRFQNVSKNHGTSIEGHTANRGNIRFSLDSLVANKMGTSKIGAISKAQKARSF